jgi:uncharacterized protein YjbJ (UPF0337 family)
MPAYPASDLSDFTGHVFRLLQPLGLPEICFLMTRLPKTRPVRLCQDPGYAGPVPEVPIHNIHWKGKQMNPSTKDEIKGKFHEVKGEVKEKVGQVTNNRDLEDEGNAEHIAGKVEKKVGQIEKVREK